MDHDLRHSDIGFGGLGCPCCAPTPGSPERRRMIRAGRRRAKLNAISEGLADHYDDSDDLPFLPEGHNAHCQYLEDTAYTV